MKKYILLALFFAMSLQTVFAQNKGAELNMKEELKQMMQRLQSTMGDLPLFTDTVFIKKFDDSQWEEGQLPFGESELDMSGMLKLLQDQFNQMEPSDWENLQELFDQLPIQPQNLDQFKQKIPEEDIRKNKTKPKKKRKTYKI